MKKAILLAVSIALSILLIMGCAPQEQKDASQASTAPAKEYKIVLDGNATTGYEWTYTANPEGIVKEVSSEYIDGNKEDTAGAPGTFVFVFEGAKEGKTTLDFSYVRSWEEEENPMTASYTLSVDADGNITEVEKTLPKEK